MLSTEAQTQNQSQQSTIYDDDCVFNERIGQLFNSIDSTSVSSPNTNRKQMTSIVDALFPEEASLYQQQSNQRHPSTNDLTTYFDRFSLWNNNNTSSASAFCGGITDSSLAFANRRQSTSLSSSCSLRNSQQRDYQRSPLTRPRFASSSIRLPSAATITVPTSNNTSGLQRTSSSLSTNSTNATTDYQPRFASRLSTTRLLTTAPPGSHIQIVGNSNTTVPASSIDVMDQPSSTSAVLSRNAPIVTMAQTTNFCYVPASDSLAYNNSTGTGRSTTVSHH